jgi:ribosomal protein S18 acetylase RimI-like enzyme
MKKQNVRLLQSLDSDSWLEMWQEYLRFYQTSLPQEVTNNTLSRLLSGDKNMGCLIASNNKGTSTGFLNYIIHSSTWKIKPECYLQDLYVKPQYRKLGVAKLLIEQLKDITRDQCSQIYWITKPDNVIAQAFYNKIAKGQPWIQYEMTTNN